MKHIEFEYLIKHFEGVLSAAEEQKVSEHLLDCRTCAAESRKLAGVLGYVQQGDYEQVPQAITANLLNIFKPEQSPAKKESFIKRLVASLTFDDWQFALNERFVLSDTRQLLYKAENFDIDLRLNFAGEKCQVSGQVFPDCKNSTVEIFSENVSEKVLLNQDCEFVLPPLQNGVYNLQIKVSGLIIEIKNISLLI